MTTQSERIAMLEQRLTDHEGRCEERLAEIKSTTTGTLAAVEGLKARFWGLVLALLAWSMAQLWSANQDRLTRLEAERPGPSQVAQLGR